MPHQLKTCDRCHQAKPATEQYFGLNLRYRDGLKTYCRACSPAVAAERRARKREKQGDQRPKPAREGVHVPIIAGRADQARWHAMIERSWPFD